MKRKTITELKNWLNSELAKRGHETRSYPTYQKLVSDNVGISKEFALQLSEITAYEVTEFLFVDKKNNVWQKLLNYDEKI